VPPVPLERGPERVGHGQEEREGAANGEEEGQAAGDRGGPPVHLAPPVRPVYQPPPRGQVTRQRREGQAQGEAEHAQAEQDGQERRRHGGPELPFRGRPARTPSPWVTPCRGRIRGPPCTPEKAAAPDEAPPPPLTP